MQTSENFSLEYEIFEKKTSDDSTSEATLREMGRKFLHAKSIAKERKRLQSVLIMDRIAVPPSNSPSEISQLEYWSDWISFEKGNPDNLAAEELIGVIRYTYDLCVC